jgi:hypothetical protein
MSPIEVTKMMDPMTETEKEENDEIVVLGTSDSNAATNHKRKLNETKNQTIGTRT